jgi:FMN reductase
MPTVLVISSSPSETSKTAALAESVANRLSAMGRNARHLRLRDLPPEALVRADITDPAIADASGLVKSADGIVVVTPTYKASYSGLLKVFLDLLPQHALGGKAILPLATGGTLAHALMLDYALRPVLHALGARHCVQGHFIIESVIDPASPEVITDRRYGDMLFEVVRQFDDALVRVTEKAA